MSFLNSLPFWGALAAAGVAVPVVIHLLSRFRSRIVDWAAMELLRRAMVVRARRVRMEDWLLLLLRCLAVLLAAFALARPVMTSAGWVGSSQTNVIIALDASLSMAHQPGVQSRFDLARQRVQDIVATLKQGDTVTLVVMGNRPQVKLRQVRFDDDRIASTLKEAAPTAEELNLETCLEEVRTLAADSKAANRECYLVTDAQLASWQHPSSRVRDTLTKLAELGTTYFVPVGSENSENLAVTRLALTSGVLRKGGTARYMAEVRNTGRHAAAKVPLRLLLDDAVEASAVIDQIAPGETVSVPLFPRWEKAGSVSVCAQLAANDPLPQDNARYAMTDISDTVRVLCVEPSPSPGSLLSETGFLSAAFSARLGDATAPATVRVETVASTEDWTGKLASHDVAVLANVAEITREQTATVDEFVRRGGGLIVFLGNRIDPTLLNGQMRNTAGEPLLPAELGEPTGEAVPPSKQRGGAEGWSLSAEIPDHPITRFLAALPQQQWSGVRFQRFFKAAPRENARVLLRLAPGEEPILVEHAVGRGRVLLMTSTASRAWNDMIVSPAYLMLWQQALTYITRRPWETPVEIPQTITFELPAGTTPVTVTVRDPKGIESSALVAPGSADAKTVAVESATAGIYAVQHAPAEPPLRVAANVAPNESAVEVLAGASLGAAAEQLSAQLIDRHEDVRLAVRERRFGRELWRPLLIGAIAMLVAEALLARWFARRTAPAAVVVPRKSMAVGV